MLDRLEERAAEALDDRARYLVVETIGVHDSAALRKATVSRWLQSPDR